MSLQRIMNPNLVLSIVIPALNEEKTIGLCVRKAVRRLGELNVPGEVVVADNGSTDGTVAVSRAEGARAVPVGERGYGAALIAGFQAAAGRYLIMGDADDSYNFEEIDPYLHALEKGADLVMGNRFRGKIEPGAMPFLHRFLGTPVLTRIMNLFFRTGIGDVNCGMRGIRKEAFEKLGCKAQGMEFATEMVIKSSLLKLRIAEVPCNLYRDKRDRPPHLKTWHDGWRHLRFMLLFAPEWTFFLPGIFFTVAGALGMLGLLARDLFFPGAMAMITSKHVLSASIVFLLGMHVVGLGVSAKTFGYSYLLDSESTLMRWMQHYFRLERGLAVGIFLFLAGCAVFGYLFTSYYFQWFVPLAEQIRWDVAVLGMNVLFLGIQTIFVSFLLSLSYLKVK